MSNKEKEIVIAKPVQAIVNKVEIKYAIENAADMEVASEWRVKLKAELKALTADKEKITDPMKEALAEIVGRYKPHETKLKAALEVIDKAMITYQTAEMRRVKEEEAKIAARVAPGRGNLSADTASDRMAEIEKPETRVATKSGATSFRPHQQLKITDKQAIPDQFWTLNESAVLAALKQGVKIPGAEIEVVQIPVNARS